MKQHSHPHYKIPLTLLLLSLLLPGALQAQTNPVTPPPPEPGLRHKLDGMTPEQRLEFWKNHPNLRQHREERRVHQVEARENNLQSRIDQGVKSGQLTPAEASSLQEKADAIKKKVAEDIADDGRLGKGEQRELNRAENRLSREIRSEKHDAQKNRGGGKAK